MEVIKLFVPHSDIGDNSSLEEAYNALDSVVKDINNNEISEWPPLARNLTIGKPEDFQINQINPIRQTANKLEEAAEKAHGIFIFVEGDISERIKEWYQEQSKLLSGLDDEECVFIRIFWDIREQKSNECFHKFKEGETLNKDSNYIKTYKSIPELKDELKKSLKKLVLTWSSMISQGIEIPTLKSIKAKKKNKLVRSILFSVICGIILLFVLFCRNYHKEQSQEQPQEPSAIMVDTTRALLNDGITHVESLVKQKEYAQALDTLMTLKKICKIEWTDEIKKIDSLKRIVSDNLRPVPPISQRTSYIKNGCIVISNNPDIVSYVRGKLIDESSLSLSFPENGKTEWLVNVNIEKALDTDTVISGVTVYKSIVVLTANIKQEGKYKGDKKYEGTARSYESKEKAFYDALQNALEGITKQIIEIIAQ